LIYESNKNNVDLENIIVYVLNKFLCPVGGLGCQCKTIITTYQTHACSSNQNPGPIQNQNRKLGK
jgi:hypothetical protein